MTKKFYKEEETWYIDLKFWPLNKKHLAMVMGADKLLDKLSKGKDEVTLEFSSRFIDDYTGVLELEQKIDKFFDGAVYKLIGGPKINYSFADTYDDNLWLCGVTTFVFLRYPKKIYYRVK